MINNIRLQIIIKGFANVTDIMKFVPCIHKKAKEIYEDIELQLKEEKKAMHPSGVNTNRLISYLGMKESQIIKCAEIERQLETEKKSPAATDDK